MARKELWPTRQSLWQWEQDRIGCYWKRGDYRIATFMEIESGRITRSGYRLYHKRIPLEDFSTLDAAQTEAESHWMAAEDA